VTANVTGDTTRQLFDGYYFAHGCGRPYARDAEWQAHFAGIADAIRRELQPVSVLDVGCAIGLLVEALRARGVEAYGVDVSEYAISQVHPTIRDFCTLHAATEPFGRRYDLIVCIEVLEHLPPEQAQAAIANFCRHADAVLFSSSPFDYVEPTHFNVQPPPYWAKLFAQQGFYRDVDLDAGFLTPWAACFRRRSEPFAAVVADYERRHWLMLQESRARLQVNLEQREQLAAAARELAGLRGTDPAAVGAAAEVQALRTQLAAIDHSAGGRLLHALQALRAKLAPPGTLRDQMLENILQRLLPFNRGQ
jgi:SAM-dependent methyltransferase